MLGANEDGEAQLRRAMVRLAMLGPTTALAVRQLPPRSGEGGWFANALVVLDSALPEDSLRPALRQIEQDLGRNRQTPARVAMDIDVLARRGEDWIADAHAGDKGEIAAYPASLLLAEAGVRIRLTPL